MKQTIQNVVMFLALIFLATGCAGFTRSCSSCSAESFGADWIVVQYDYKGNPINCWKLMSVSISNEQNSDGIYWKESGHLIHISGWYNRIQVDGGRFDEAAKLLGVDLSKIRNVLIS